MSPQAAISCSWLAGERRARKLVSRRLCRVAGACRPSRAGSADVGGSNAFMLCSEGFLVVTPTLQMRKLRPRAVGTGNRGPIPKGAEVRGWRQRLSGCVEPGAGSAGGLTAGRPGLPLCSGPGVQYASVKPGVVGGGNLYIHSRGRLLQGSQAPCQAVCPEEQNPGSSCMLSGPLHTAQASPPLPSVCKA